MARISSRNITQAPGTPRVPLRDRQQTPEPEVPLRDKQQTPEPDMPQAPESGEPNAPQQSPEPDVPQTPESGESCAPQQPENLVFVQKVPNSRNNMYRLCEKRNGKVVHISSLGYTSQIQYKQKVAEAYAERLNKLRGH